MVDYWNTNIEENPHCSHGPTLLFSRKDRPLNKFYACAAFRDRKKCPFYRQLPDGAGNQETTSNSIVAKKYKYIKDKNAKYRNYGRFISSIRNQNILDSDDEKYSYCRHCELILISKSRDQIDCEDCVTRANTGCFLSSFEESDNKPKNVSQQKLLQLQAEHSSHIVDIPFSRDRLSRPSTIIEARTNAKAESQYFFSSNTVQFLADMLRQQNVTAVVCIGCPRLHEYLLMTKTANSYPSHSMLLDIDSRYLQFYNDYEFQLFNMFNCHFFDDNGWKFTKAFCKDNRIALVVDPPFGGRIEALAYTLTRFIERIKKQDDKIDEEQNAVSASNILVLLIMPYFMEPHIRKHMPNFDMLDYKVEYENHKKFSSRAQSGTDNEQNKGSAVRVFVNVDRSSFKLSPQFGYKYCSVCARWVYRANKHCYKCGDCTSKNGGKYKHCDLCSKCVKITWKHCKTCGICKLKEHVCSTRLSSDNLLSIKCKAVFRMKRKSNRKKQENVSKKTRKNICGRNRKA